jgi:predicted MFS family arabinose efflux permease
MSRWIAMPAPGKRAGSAYTASFSLGTSGSFLITGAMADAFGWRAAFGLATAAAGAAFLLVAFGLPPVKPIPAS